MGKTRACAAAKKNRNSAKCKNLEFLTGNENSKRQPKVTRKVILPSKPKVENASDPEPSIDKKDKTFAIEQFDNQQPGTSYHKCPQQGKKANALLTSSATPDPGKHDESSLINLGASTSRQQITNVAMDILMDWTEFDTENTSTTFSDNLNKDASEQPSKRIGKTYTRPKTAKENLANRPSNSERLEQTVSSDIVCVCGQQEKVAALLKQNKEQASQMEKIRTKYEECRKRCLKLTDSLNSKFLGKPHEDVFTAIEGSTSKEKLKKISEAAQNSDYVFVKLLMHDVWPMGLKDRSVTGRASNNPQGRSKTEDIGGLTDGNAATPKTPLEPEKVSYIEDRLFEHRTYQGDSGAEARVKAKECGREMARVIAYYGKKEAPSAD